MTFFLLLLFGITIGAKSAGLDTVRFVVLIAVLGAISYLHFRMMRKKLARYQNAEYTR